MDVLSSIDFWKFAAPFFGAILAWIVNEWRKQYWELYKRKEDNYKRLLESVRGYYVGSEDEELKEEFLNQINQCWLYCPDDVIKKGYDFLYLIQTGVKATDNERNKALGEFVCAIRNDIYPKKKFIWNWKLRFRYTANTDLTPKDFKVLLPEQQIKN